MDKYEQEMYNFLTERTNFEAMLKVMSQFRFVKEELLRNFWNQVHFFLSDKSNDGTNKWQILNPTNKENPKAKLIVYKNMWRQNAAHPFVGVAWEGLFGNAYLGVYNDINSKSINSEKLRKALEDIKNQLGYLVDTDWWPMWQHGPYNFSVDSDLVYILPDRLAGTAEEYADKLLQLLHKVETIIDTVVLN